VQSLCKVCAKFRKLSLAYDSRTTIELPEVRIRKFPKGVILTGQLKVAK